MFEHLLIQIDILWPALIAGLLVLSTHVPLGREVLKRGIIFLDLAIAQVAALGLVVASLLGISHGEHHELSQLVAIVTAVIGAMVLYCFHHLAPSLQEALIGIVFMLAATGSILLLAQDPHGGERLKELLVGQILWVQPQELLFVAIVFGLSLTAWFKYQGVMGQWLFYCIFAVVITLATQLVGVYLVFASLILPSLATLKHTKPLRNAYIIGFIGYLLGLVFSAMLDLPSGAMIAWCLALVAATYTIFCRLTARG